MTALCGAVDQGRFTSMIFGTRRHCLKPDGKGEIKKYDIENLLVCGVTTEVCVHATVREAYDRCYRCASYFRSFTRRA